MNNRRKFAVRGRRGFSMIEVALALLILSIGVLTMVGLMSGGLDMNKSAQDYTQAAIFASDSLEGLRSFAENGTPTNGTTRFWSTLQTGLGLKAVMGYIPGIFDNETTLEGVSNKTTFTTFFYSYATNVDMVCRYRLSVEQFKDVSTGGLLTGNLLDQVATVKMEVINGLYGAAATQSFYTEVMQFAR